MKIVCLHGFLGSGEDFSFLNNDFDILAPDLDMLVHLDLCEIENLLFNDINEKVILIGYSFGARLAMQLFLNNPTRFSRVLLLAGHMGLNDQLLRDERLVFEQKMIQLLDELPMDQFIKTWNSYNIFEYDEDIRKTKQRNKEAQLYFSRWGLSKQPYMRDDLITYKKKIKIFYGNRDKKYCDYAKQFLNQFNVSYIENVGHRIIQHQDVIKNILKEESC